MLVPFRRAFQSTASSTQTIARVRNSSSSSMHATNPKSMTNFLNKFVHQIKYPVDKKHRYFVVAHLFDDTERMLDSLSDRVKYDAIVGVPYSSSKPETIEAWQRNPHYGDRVSVQSSMAAMEIELVEQLNESLTNCDSSNQELIVVDCGGYVAPLLHKHFPNHLHLVKGVVEITKQGVWRAEAIVPAAFPVLHCADSELKRLEAKRCGETVARCIDGVARGMGLSLAGRQATVFGAGWIGSGVMTALKRLDMIPTVVDTDPVKVVEARLNGFLATTDADEARIEESDLVIGTTGQTSITRDVLDRISGGTMVASVSSRQSEIDVEYLQTFESTAVSESVESYQVENEMGDLSSILLLNQGFPANFIPSSGSVADEIVEMILAEMIVLMQFLAMNKKMEAGVHRISIKDERKCADLWLKLRHEQQQRSYGTSMGSMNQMRAFSTSVNTNIVAGRKSFSTSAKNKTASMSTTAPPMEADHSPYLVQRLIGQKPNLYGVAKFAIISEEIRKVTANMDRPVRILDLGCSTAISKEYLVSELGEGAFEYCGVDYEAAFEPDIVMDICQIHQRKDEIPWTPDIILLLDVLEHLPGKAKDIAQVMAECDKLVPPHGLVLAAIPQLYRLDRLKLGHLHYPEHEVRFTLEEWKEIIAPVTKIEKVQGIGYISCLSYLPMFSPWYKEDNMHGSFFRFLRGTLLEWGPLKPLDIALTRILGRIDFFKGWCNSSLLVCRRSDDSTKK